MAEYKYGEILGNPVGTTYENRAKAAIEGVHQVRVQGIAGNRHVGCVSIVLNGGYDTDEDHGHEIFYTGSGGQDPNNRTIHIAHQDLDSSDNAALLTSEHTGEPVRIIRGFKGDRDHSPSSGYRYDGLYKVVNHYPLYPADGWRRWMFRLVQLTASEADEYTPWENAEANDAAFRDLDLGSGPENAEPDDIFGLGALREALSTVGGAPNVKALYEDTCQICGTRLTTPAGGTSVAAHIRPLGRPHHGKNLPGNLLCLCPNHQALLRRGGIYVDDDLNVYDFTHALIGPVVLKPGHRIDLNNVRYHRAVHGYDSE